MMKEKFLEKEKNKRIIIIAMVALLLLVSLVCLFGIKKEYVVTFDSNGGSEVATIKIKENEKVTRPEDPTKEGYNFAGWYNHDELYDFDTPVKQDLTLKAEWEEIKNAEVEGIELNVAELTIAPEGTAVLVATLLPENAKQVKLIWTSSDENIATVDENGNIKAIKEGTVVITVATEDGKFVANCTVTITKDVIAVEGVSISGEREVYTGESINLIAKVMPENATNTSVAWNSSNSYIAKVDQNGKVTGVRAGTVTITVTTVDGGHKATYTVTVKANPTPNQNTQTTSSSKPSSATTPSQSSQPSNPGTSSTPNAPSTPNTPSTPTNPEPSNIPVASVSISGKGEIIEGEQTTLSAMINPSNATNRSVTWSSNNPSVATVDGNGRVTGVSAGTAIITVTTSNGKIATHSLTVKEKEATYVLYLTPSATMEGTGAVMQYNFRVTKNGVNFTDYNGLVYGGETIPSTTRTIKAATANKGGTTATIILRDGTTKTATVVK